MSTLKGLRILLVEDEALIAMMAEDMLETIGCTLVATAPSVGDALAALEVHTPDLCMLDVNLNGERSMIVADRARAMGVPYVFTTGYGSDGVAPEHAHAPVLAKPYILADLEAMLTKCAAQGTDAGTSSITSSVDSKRG